MTYPHANALREGPNVSHRRRPNYRAAIWGATVAALAFCAIYAWRLQ
jgi:hypothetical protein